MNYIVFVKCFLGLVGKLSQVVFTVRHFGKTKMLDRNLTKVGHRRETHCPIAGCSEFPFNKVSRCRVCQNDGQGKQNNDNNNNNNNNHQASSSIVNHHQYRQPSSISLSLSLSISIPISSSLCSIIQSLFLSSSLQSFLPHLQTHAAEGL